MHDGEVTLGTLAYQQMITLGISFSVKVAFLSLAVCCYLTKYRTVYEVPLNLIAIEKASANIEQQIQT